MDYTTLTPALLAMFGLDQIQWTAANAKVLADAPLIDPATGKLNPPVFAGAALKELRKPANKPILDRFSLFSKNPSVWLAGQDPKLQGFLQPLLVTPAPAPPPPAGGGAAPPLPPAPPAGGGAAGGAPAGGGGTPPPAGGGGGAAPPPPAPPAGGGAPAGGAPPPAPPPPPPAGPSWWDRASGAWGSVRGQLARLPPMRKMVPIGVGVLVLVGLYGLYEIQTGPATPAVTTAAASSTASSTPAGTSPGTTTSSATGVTNTGEVKVTASVACPSIVAVGRKLHFAGHTMAQHIRSNGFEPLDCGFDENDPTVVVTLDLKEMTALLEK